MAKSFLLEESRLEAMEAEVGQDIKGKIAKREAELDKPRSQTIEHSGMSAGAFYAAWKDPAKFRVGQLLRIYDFLRIPESERRLI